MRRMIGALAIACAIALTTAGTASAQDAPLPVNFDLTTGISDALIHPGGFPPGTNDWNCRPSAAHPRPVVLVHGTGTNAQSNWGVYGPLLKNEGYCVYALTYGAHKDAPGELSTIGGMRSMADSAVEFAAFADRVLKATGASKIDVVGHSQGTIVPTYYAKRLGGADKIDKYVSLSPIWRGTDIAYAQQLSAFGDAIGATPVLDATIYAECAACKQLVQGSPFLTSLEADGVYLPGITYTNIATTGDDVVVPYTNGVVPGPNVTNIVLQDTCRLDFANHVGTAADERAAMFVLDALDPAHPHPVPCKFVLPYTG
ncbi:esterase/lipase family protein [Antrihabitans cavernicola]|uniref:Alpha/beta fold hydrolase n=1 Tax=Antrihabitans cavernicola TaxID=2495913 RepID=A0A5A7SC35_9NOCA|nr:alpha/beta fold hydrolase [Spelaeibacter cavernicola]KAA0022045.1 alpha/beta fold hydrolase [Spelaeibacter cavernicola]